MPARKARHLDYAAAGVSIARGDALVEKIKPLCQATLCSEVIAGPGGFAGLLRLSTQRYRKPVLVASVDGVGTKLQLAAALGRHDTIGIDLVAMCANDVLAQGGEPLLFLDYFACDRLSVAQAETVISGVAAGCIDAGCSLIGGETAEMPGTLAAGQYDVAGFCVGLAGERNLCGAHRVNVGDSIIGLASSGVHANGYSLVRKIIAKYKVDLLQVFNGRSLGEVLLDPTLIYVKALLPLIRQGKVGALAHVTGGGIAANLARILNEGQAAKIDRARWPRPAIFDWLQQTGNITEEEMLKVFNCGIGMVAVVAEDHVADVLEHLHGSGCCAWRIGAIHASAGAPGVMYN